MAMLDRLAAGRRTAEMPPDRHFAYIAAVKSRTPCLSPRGYNDEDRRLYKEAAPRLDKHQHTTNRQKKSASRKKSRRMKRVPCKSAIHTYNKTRLSSPVILYHEVYELFLTMLFRRTACVTLTKVMDEPCKSSL